MLSIGDKFEGYTVKSYLGRGGMGTVMLLENDDGGKAALKILHPHLMDDDELVKRFYLEAEVAQRIESPHICKVFGIHEISLGDAPSHGILMEYVEGESLADLMENREMFNEEWALHVGEGVLEALVAIHNAGLIHRDLKPENIVITPDDQVKVLDLGLAKVLESSIKLSKTGYFIGTYQYASPEQLTGDDLDFSCDIYSLGIVLYEITTAARPHDSDDIRELIYEKVNTPVRAPSRLNPTLSPFFDMLVEEMMEIKPRDRLSRADVVLQIIREREKSDWYRARISVSISRDSLAASTVMRRLVRVPRRTALYGRKDELEALKNHALPCLGFDGKEDSHSGIILIGGEAGIGKTRLIEEFVGSLDSLEKPYVVLLGRALRERRHVPYSPLIEMVRDFFMLDEDVEIDLLKLFEEYLENLRPLIPPFLELITQRRFMDDSRTRGVLNESNILHLFRTLFKNIAVEVPLIMFFDDLQWADVNTISVLNYIVGGDLDVPLLLLGSFREEEIEAEEGTTHPLKESLARIAGKDAVLRLSLTRLNEEACHDVVTECFPAAGFIDDLTGRLYRQSDGNPFFLMEIINFLVDEGRIGFKDGKWQIRGDLDEVTIPESLKDIVSYRLDQLNEKEREVLEAASIIGFKFKSDLLGELTELNRIKLLRFLQTLEKKRHLIVSFEAGYRFDHHVFYETVYQGILPELRIAYHQLTAELFRAQDDINSVIYELVYHMRLAGDYEGSLEFLPKAVERARDEYSNRLALEHANHAWEAYRELGEPEIFNGEICDLMAERCEVAGILGERDIELDSANTVLKLSMSLGDMERISLGHRLLGEYFRHISFLDAALDEYTKALESCPEDKSIAFGQILRETASVNHLKGNTAGSIELYVKALEILKEFPPGPELIKTHNNLGISYKKEGRLEDAVREFETAYDLASELKDLHSEMFPLGNIALIYYDAGRWEEAHSNMIKLLNRCEQIGDIVGQARTQLNIANIFYQVGMMNEAEKYFAESLKTRRQTDHRQGEALVLHHLAHVNLYRGEYDSAIEHLTEAMTIGEDIGDMRGVSGALIALARAYNQCEKFKIGYECAKKAVEIATDEKLGNRFVEAKVEQLLAKCGLEDDFDKIADEVKKLAGEDYREEFRSLGPKGFLRMKILLDLCELEDMAEEFSAEAKNLAEDKLDKLKDPEWRASYRLLNREILKG
jgi:serine/threonine protein kinase/tetratricopeptide (TPR) repeat protein